MSLKQKLGKIKIVSKNNKSNKELDSIKSKNFSSKETEKIKVNIFEEKVNIFEEKVKDKKYNKEKEYDDYMEGGEFSDDIIEQADFKSAEEKEDGDVEDPDRELNEDINDEGPKEGTDSENTENDAGETNEGEENVEDEENEEIEEDEEDKLDENEGYGDEEEEEKGEQDVDESCLYNFVKKKEDIYDEEEEEETELHFEDDDEIHNDVITDPTLREAKPVLTKYERVRILGDRARQLSLGAKSMLLNVDNIHPKEIARLELELGKMPLKIEKVFPNGRKEIWKVSELKIVN